MDNTSISNRISDMRLRVSKISALIDSLENFVLETKDIVTAAQIATQIKIAEDNLWPKDFASKMYLKAAQGSQLRASAKPFTLSEIALSKADMDAANIACSKSKI